MRNMTWIERTVAATAVLLMHCGSSSPAPDASQSGSRAVAASSSSAATSPSGAGQTSGSGSSSRTSTAASGSLDASAPKDASSPSRDDASGGSADAETDAAAHVDGSADASASSYAPCPTDGSNCKILPLGDSITYGIQYAGAYRVELFHDALTDHKKITFVGDSSLADGPATVDGVPFPQDNQGHSGWTIDQIAGLVPSPALDQDPAIVLLMIGTNDMYSTTQPVSQAPTRLGSLIDKIVTAVPNALLVVAQITPLRNSAWEQQVVTYDAAIPAVVQARASAGKHVSLVDMHTGFQVSTMLSSDGVHPNQTGYNHMGDVWYAAIKSVLP